MSTRANITEQKWERGWDGHALEQLRRLARLPLREKIAWLEQAQRVAQHLTAQQTARPVGQEQGKQ
jgi:hypothetical protein